MQTRKQISSNGFTLLEVLVALTILAVVSTTVFKQISYSNSQIERFEKQTFARFIAQNKLAEIRLNLSSEADPKLSIDYSNWEWNIDLIELDSENSETGLRFFQTKVFLLADLENSIYQLNGYAD